MWFLGPLIGFASILNEVKSNYDFMKMNLIGVYALNAYLIPIGVDETAVCRFS